MKINERFTPVVNFDDALKQLAEDTTIREKRIILLEIGGIILADGVFLLRKKPMEKIADSLGTDNFQCEEVISMVRDLYEVYSKIDSFLSSK